MPVERFLLDVRRQHNNRWLMAMNIKEASKRLRSEAKWVHVFEIPPGEILDLSRFRYDSELVFCPHRFVTVDWADMAEDQSDYRRLDDDPEGPNFLGLLFTADHRYKLRNVDDELACVIVISSEESELWVDRANRTSFNLHETALELGDPVTWLYINNMDQGAVAGNHAHKKKSELFFATIGSFDVWTQQVAISGQSNIMPHGQIEKTGLSAEPKSSLDRICMIPPRFAHAVRATGKNVSRLMVLATGEPRDNDDYKHVIMPQLRAKAS